MPLPLIAALVGMAIKAANKLEQKPVVANSRKKSKKKSRPMAKVRAAKAGGR
jgi:hypothetical protein